MRTKINVNHNILTWAITRAGYDLDTFIDKNPPVKKWLDDERAPTVRQLENFAKKVYLPFGYLFLNEPPEEKLPIPYFRSNGNKVNRVGVNVYDTILLLQQRQDWLRDYLKENDFGKLSFVGRFRQKLEIDPIVNDIRNILKLKEDWAKSFQTWEDALDHLVEIIEDRGIIIVFNGVVENSTRRKIEVEECRGFVLVDDIAPFMFVNNADFKSAQMFTIVHELAHIWTGHSAGFDFRKLQPADDPIEQLCDKVAAEFLVPQNAFNKLWKSNQNTKFIARQFKVSEIVVARRALDTGKWSKKEFFKFYEDYKNKELIRNKKKTSGGNFYATARKRLSITFASHINQAVKTGQLLYRDAYKLTSLKGDTFEKFFAKHF